MAASPSNFLFLRMAEEAAGIVEYATKCASQGPMAVADGREADNFTMLLKELNETIVAVEMFRTECMAHGIQMPEVVQPETHDQYQAILTEKFRKSMQAGMHNPPTRPILPDSLRPPHW